MDRGRTLTAAVIHDGEWYVARCLDRVPPWSDQTSQDAATADGAHELAGWLRDRGARSATVDG